MKELAYINKYFYKYKWHLILGIIFVAVSNWFRILQPQYIRDAMDLVVKDLDIIKTLGNQAEIASKKEELGWQVMRFGGIVLLCSLMMGIFMFFMRQTIIVMSRLVENDLREEIYAHYQKLTLAFYRKNNTGDLMSRSTEDVAKVRMYLGPAMLYGINLITLFSQTIYTMWQVNPKLTLYSLIPLPILSLSIYYVSDLISKRSGKIQQQLAHLTSIAQEAYSGIRVIKSYTQEKAMVAFFSKESDIYKEKTMDMARIEAAFFPTMVFLIGLSTLIVIYVGGVLVLETSALPLGTYGKVTPGNIAEFVIYISMLTWPVSSIGWIASLVQQASASQKRINEFLKTKPDIVNSVSQNTHYQGNIDFKNVTFVYPDTGIKALDNISFSIKSGEKLAIIGRTGAGKTTIADLLLRMYDVSEGEILIDGKNIKATDIANLRQKTGYVPQDVFLFSDAVNKNIAFGKVDATQNEIEDAARFSAIYDEILGLSDGFETVVGERGVTLSGGQKQRISIARALVKKPDIIILDDCLSAVDTNTEQTIVSYLNNQLGDKTSIIITHRIYGLLKFDKIIVIDDGKLSEIGTHEELIKNGGYYSELFENQQITH
jgi:ATP-binding cassette, subfamily B, multidrug efflux pump